MILISNERRLSNWVNNILDFAMINSGGFVQEIIHFNIIESLEEVIMAQTPLAEKLQVNLEIDKINQNSNNLDFVDDQEQQVCADNKRI